MNLLIHSANREETNKNHKKATKRAECVIYFLCAFFLSIHLLINQLCFSAKYTEMWIKRFDFRNMLTATPLDLTTFNPIISSLLPFAFSYCRHTQNEAKNTKTMTTTKQKNCGLDSISHIMFYCQSKLLPNQPFCIKNNFGFCSFELWLVCFLLSFFSSFDHLAWYCYSFTAFSLMIKHLPNITFFFF